MPSTVGQLFGHPEPATWLKNLSSDLLVSDNRIGLELELGGFNNQRVVDLTSHWTVTSDASVRDFGLEFVFSAPMFGEDVIDALLSIEQTLRPMSPVKSYDGSVHCHVDVRQMEAPQLARFINLYIMLETVVFRKFAPSREGNAFCWSVRRSDPYFCSYNQFVRGLTLRGPTRAPNTSDFNRYSSMNLQALDRFGSLEFRGHESEYEAERLLPWINTLLQIQKASLREDIDPTRPYLFFKGRDYEQAFNDVMQGVLVWDKSFLEPLLDGFRTSRSIANASRYTLLTEEFTETFINATRGL